MKYFTSYLIYDFIVIAIIIVYLFTTNLYDYSFNALLFLKMPLI
jgi:hypothetical protein